MRIWLFIAAVNGGLAVLCGAFAAHGLSARLDAPDALSACSRPARAITCITPSRWDLAALAGAWDRDRGGRKSPAWLFLAGIVLFSGSLYLLVLTGMRMLGFVTPFGGLAFLGGLAVSGAWRRCVSRDARRRFFLCGGGRSAAAAAFNPAGRTHDRPAPPEERLYDSYRRETTNADFWTGGGAPRLELIYETPPLAPGRARGRWWWCAITRSEWWMAWPSAPWWPASGPISASSPMRC